MHFFNVARGLERGNKQCTDILLICKSDISIENGYKFLLTIFKVIVYSDPKQSVGRSKLITPNKYSRNRQNTQKENSYCAQIYFCISSTE